MNKSVFLLATCLSCSVMAGLNDGILAYKYQQYPTALAELTYLQEEGDPAACYYLGLMYLNGQGVSLDPERAMALFQAAEKAYYYPAATQIAHIYLDAASISQALPYLKKAALTGDAEAAYQLGQIYSEPQYGLTDLNQAYGYYLISALGGHMKGQYQLAKMYVVGRGVPQDYRSAFVWLGRSAKQGYVLAQIDIADLFQTNKQFENKGNAYAWYAIVAAYNADEVGQKAQEKRDELEKKLDKKIVIEKQKALAKWKVVPAEKSVPTEEKEKTKIPLIQGFNDINTLQNFLATTGVIPRNSNRFGITNDMIDQAIATQNADILTQAIEKAQQSGKKDAYGYYGDLFKTRLNNIPQAFLWYKKGADAGDVYARFQMGKMLCEGQGVQPDGVGCYHEMLKVQKAQNPILNGLVQQVLSLIQTQIPADQLQTETDDQAQEEKKESSSGGFNFF